MPARLPRAKDKDAPMVVTGRLWDMLCEMVERTQKLSVSPPLFMSQGPEGFSIGSINASAQVSFAKLTADWSTNTTASAYVIGNPCTQSGGTTSTNALYLHIASPMVTIGFTQGALGGCPLRTGAVVAYQPYATPFVSGTNSLAGVLYPWLQQQIFGVRLTQNGGSDGGTASACTYLYTARDMIYNGTVGGSTALAPDHQRPDGPTKVATIGIFSVQYGGTNSGLIWTDEVAKTTADCSS